MLARSVVWLAIASFVGSCSSDERDDPPASPPVEPVAATREGCQPAHVAEVVDELQRDARDPAFAIVDGFVRACEPPPFVIAFFSRTRGERAPVAQVSRPSSEEWALFARVCPEAEQVNNERAHLPRAQGNRLMFDRCGLGELDLVSREAIEYMAIVTPLATYRWLLDRGVAVDDAKVLTRALLERSRRARQTVHMRAAVHVPRVEPSPRLGEDGLFGAVSLAVGMSSLHIENTEIRMQGGLLLGKPSTKRLAETLEQRVNLEREIRQTRGETEALTMTLVIDANVPLATVEGLVRVGIRAGVERLALVVRTREDGYRALIVTPVAAHQSMRGLTPKDRYAQWLARLLAKR